MRRFWRLGALAIMVLAALVTRASALSRDGTRDFPHSVTCPGNFFNEPLENPPLVFTAQGSTATLTFKACNNDPIDVTIELDHVMVVDKTVWDNDRLDYPTNPKLLCDPTAAGYDPLKCYGIRLFKSPTDSTGICYGQHVVKSVFDRGAVAHFTKQWPFDEDFDHALQPWTLTGNSSITPKSQKDEPNVPVTHVLTLINQEDTNSCRTASVVVGNLIKTRQYVVDFTWWVSPDNFQEGDAVMTVDFQ